MNRTKRIKNDIQVGCLMLMLLLLALPTVAWAGETDPGTAAGSIIRYDFTDDQAGYAARVAALNRGEIPPDSEGMLFAQSVDENIAQRRGQSQTQGKTLTAVLCRTDGREPDFDICQPDYIVAGPYDCYTLYFSNETDADAAVEELSAMPGIRYAELDTEVESCEVSTVEFQSKAASAMHYGPYLSWASTAAEGSVTVAVVDSGVYPHPMYADRLLASGSDFIDGDNDATNDGHGHGTNVTGIIADCTQGFSVFFYPIRVLDNEGNGSVLNTINGIREAIEKGVDIINMSLATKEKISVALDDAVLDALDAGITVVAAAGNSSIDTGTVSPAHLTDEGVIIVGAVDDSGALTYYTNYGDSVDVYVYGNSIRCCSNSGDYTFSSGTSMSAPHMSGLASLLILTHSGITPAEIETRILNSTDRSASIRIPNITGITPDNPGFSLTQLRMDLQDSYQLSTQIFPLTATEPVTYASSDESVVTVLDGIINPVSPGTAVITSNSLGFPEWQFEVVVTYGECAALLLPQNIKSIETESFYGNNQLTHVIIPNGCETIGAAAFDACSALQTIEIPASVSEIENNGFSDAVLLVQEDSAAKDYAIGNSLDYITLTD